MNNWKPIAPDELATLRAENAALREELLRQWEPEHSRNCNNMNCGNWPATGDKSGAFMKLILAARDRAFCKDAIKRIAAAMKAHGYKL